MRGAAFGRLLPFCAAALLGVAGCSSSAQLAASPSARPATASPSPSPSPSPRPAVTAAAVRGSKVLTIVLENAGQAATLQGMPTLASLARTYGRTTRYRALGHASLPNYIALAGGPASGVPDDATPAEQPVHGPSVFDRALAAGHTAATYAEAMPAPCARTDGRAYQVTHNPWAYFADAASRAQCLRHDLPAGTLTSGALHRDVTAGTLPRIGLLVPDRCHSAHDCSLGTADRWVAAWLHQLRAGPDWRAGRLAVVVTFDEGADSGDNTVLTVVIAPGVHRVVTSPLTHLSWTRWMSALAGGGRVATTSPSLGALFGI